MYKKRCIRYGHLYPCHCLPLCKIGEGSVVMQGSILQSCCQTGKHCIVNTGAAIDHECILEDYVHVSPHATLCGNVEVGEGSWIGAGAVINPGVKIGKWTIIGSGSVVCKDIPDGVTACGSPCRIIKIIHNHEEEQIYPLFQISAGLSYSRLSDIIDLSCPIVNHLVTCHSQQG